MTDLELKKIVDRVAALEARPSPSRTGGEDRFSNCIHIGGPNAKQVAINSSMTEVFRLKNNSPGDVWIDSLLFAFKDGFQSYLIQLEFQGENSIPLFQDPTMFTSIGKKITSDFPAFAYKLRKRRNWKKGQDIVVKYGNVTTAIQINETYLTTVCVF